MKQWKNKALYVKLTDDEKRMIEQGAELEGFNVSQFVLWLVRKYFKKREE